MPNNLFSGSITRSKDGSLYCEFQSLRVRASKRFTPDQLLPLHEWLNSATTQWDEAPIRVAGLVISYTHETGQIRLETSGGIKYFDPLDDEAFARLVRYLKSRAPLPRGEPQPNLPGLPTPTPAQLAARTIFKNARVAHGSGSTGGHSSRGVPRRSAASYSASKDRLALLMNQLRTNLAPSLSA